MIRRGRAWHEPNPGTAGAHHTDADRAGPVGHQHAGLAYLSVQQQGRRDPTIAVRRALTLRTRRPQPHVNAAGEGRDLPLVQVVPAPTSRCCMPGHRNQGSVPDRPEALQGVSGALGASPFARSAYERREGLLTAV